MITSLKPIFPMVYEPYRAAQRRLLMSFDKRENWRRQTKLLKLSKAAVQRMEWFIYYQTTAKHNAALCCRHFAIPPKTFYKWKGRFNEKNLRTLEDQSKAPKKVRQKQITSQEESRIVKLRREHMVWGKMKLRRLYLNTHKERISSWKIQYTIQIHHLYPNPAKNEKLKLKRKRNQAKKRVTELRRQPFPGFLIALDTIVIYGNGFKRYILTAIDWTSKIAFARMYTTKSSKSAADFLKRMFFLLDGSLLNALTDNGSEFQKEFRAACSNLHINHYFSRVKTPTDNPVDERFNGTLRREFLSQGNFHSDPAIFNRNLTEWLAEYNFVRPHQTLGYDTPWKFYSKTARVLPMYSSRTGS